MTTACRATSLLIVAHGERGGTATNDNVLRLARSLAARGVVDEVGYGFIKGMPAVHSAMAALRGPEVIVYPLLLSDGYFTSVVLPRLLHEAMSRRQHLSVRILPPMGLDPGLAGLIVARASAVATLRGLDLRQTTLVLLAHGSTRDPASQRATERVACAVSKLARFGSVRRAFLDQPPMLSTVAAAARGPAVIVGLFAGEGRHGVDDVRALMEAHRRTDLHFAGNVASFPEIADLVAASISATTLPPYPFSAGESGARTRQEFSPHCSKDDLEVEPQRPSLDVFEIVVDARDGIARPRG
jgi:sirohydrochlorin cobaltochelatase